MNALGFVLENKLLTTLIIVSASLFIATTVLGVLKSETTDLLNECRQSIGVCEISINDDIGSLQPLLLRTVEHDGNEAYYLPKSNGIITFSQGDVVQLTCPGGTVEIDGVSTGNLQEQVTCDVGKWFHHGERKMPFALFECSQAPQHTIRATDQLCENVHQKIEIGFQLTDDRFLRTMLICFDKEKQATLYSHYNLSRFIGGYQIGVTRPPFAQDDFFNIGEEKLDTLYSREKQRETINTLVGLELEDQKYIQSSNDFFLARGHLTAMSDFVFGAQQVSTFHYVNVAPQWQTFNSGNWNSLEKSLYKFAATLEHDLLVYTGGAQVAALPHEVGNYNIDLYFYENGNKRAIPVPRFFWKLIVHPVDKSSILFVGVNNPYITDIDLEVLCEDICKLVPWLEWDAENIDKGYSYCCAGESIPIIVGEAVFIADDPISIGKICDSLQSTRSWKDLSDCQQ